MSDFSPSSNFPTKTESTTGYSFYLVVDSKVYTNYGKNRIPSTSSNLAIIPQPKKKLPTPIFNSFSPSLSGSLKEVIQEC